MVAKNGMDHGGQKGVCDIKLRGKPKRGGFRSQKRGIGSASRRKRRHRKHEMGEHLSGREGEQKREGGFDERKNNNGGGKNRKRGPWFPGRDPFC